jgi:hypothetical protein
MRTNNDEHEREAITECGEDMRRHLENTENARSRKPAPVLRAYPRKVNPHDTHVTRV